MPIKNHSIILLAFAIFLGTCTVYGQDILAPSIYIGTGLGTNLGGTVGVGVEIRIDTLFSFSAAGGKWRDLYGFDAGIKYYPCRKGLFLGLNYGVIEEAMWTEYLYGQPVTHVEKNYGFSFTAGYRFAIVHGAYLSGFLGITADDEANTVRVFERSGFIPRFGVMLGYEFNRGY